MDEDAPCGARAPLCRCVSGPWLGRGAYVYNLKHVVILGIYIQTCKASQNTESLFNKVEFSMGKYLWRTLYKCIHYTI